MGENAVDWIEQFLAKSGVHNCWVRKARMLCLPKQAGQADDSSDFLAPDKALCSAKAGIDQREIVAARNAPRLCYSPAELRCRLEGGSDVAGPQ